MTTITMTKACELYRAGNNAGRGFAPPGDDGTIDDAVEAYVNRGGEVVLERRTSDDVAVVSSPWSDSVLIAIGGDAAGGNAWAVELPADAPLPRVDFGSAPWHVPPECQGQIVERAYSTDAKGHPLCRTIDAGEGSVRYEQADEPARDDYDPANTEPGGYSWRMVQP